LISIENVGSKGLNVKPQDRKYRHFTAVPTTMLLIYNKEMFHYLILIWVIPKLVVYFRPITLQLKDLNQCRRMVGLDRSFEPRRPPNNISL